MARTPKVTTSGTSATATWLSARVKELDADLLADQHNRQAAIEDLKFALGQGNQWDPAVRAEREVDGRPTLEVNLFPQFISQVTGDIRHNRPRARITPGDSTADVQIARIREGIIADSEYQSNSDYIYVEAATSNVTCGYGAWRVRTRYTEENPFIQEFYDELIDNPFTVVMDRHAKCPIYSDAGHGWIIGKMPVEDFKKEYPGKALPGDSLSPGEGLSYQNWFDDETVTVAEYFVRKKVKKTICLMSDGSVIAKADVPAALANESVPLELSSEQPLAPPNELPANPQAAPVLPQAPMGGLPMQPAPLTIVKERETEYTTIKRYVITACDILSKNGLDGEDVPGTIIPIILLTGHRTNIEGKTYISGLVRNAKDAAKNVNYWACLDIATPLPTPHGWTTMGDVKAGDRLIDEKGNPCTVLGTSPVHIDRECFRIKFDDGSSIVTDKSHLWQVEERRGDPSKYLTKIVNTGELIPHNHIVHVTEPLNLPTAKLPVDPYVLGVWIGDGDGNNGRITCGSMDAAETRFQLEKTGASLSRDHYGKRDGDTASVFTILGLKPELRSLDLLKNKHIPPQYLRASHTQRLSLLQGLMDTDGSIDKKFQCSFTTIYDSLARDFAELLRSLGIKAVSIHRAGRTAQFKTMDKVPRSYTSECKPCHQFSFTCPMDQDVFRMGRKLAIQQSKVTFHPRRTKRHHIVSVESVESVPTKCVTVDSPSHLFLAGEMMIPTHNSALAERIALEPKSPWVGTARQFEGYEEDYRAANVKNFPFLKYNPDQTESGQPLPPPMRQGPGAVPGALFTQLQSSMSMFESAIGMTGTDLGASGPERTGAAVTARQKPGDVRTFSYIDNLARGIAHGAKIKNEMISELYDTPRDVRLRGLDDTETYLPVNMPVRDAYKMIQAHPERYKGMNTTKLIAAAQQQGWDAKFNDITAGRYAVRVTVGPSYATQRQESSEYMLRLVSALPKQMGLGADLIVGNSGVVGAEVLAERIKKTLPPGMAKPTPGEDPMPPQPTPPQVMLQMEKAKLEQQKVALQAAKVEVEKLRVAKEAQGEMSSIRQEILSVLAELHGHTPDAGQQQAPTQMQPGGAI